MKASNLIEQLGGYEEAKKSLSLPKYGWYDELVSELLEYRREHNIFEVGDAVVFDKPCTLSAVFNVETLTEKLKNPKTLRCGRWGNYPVGKNSVSHATPEEIEAGKRL